MCGKSVPAQRPHTFEDRTEKQDGVREVLLKLELWMAATASCFLSAVRTGTQQRQRHARQEVLIET